MLLDWLGQGFVALTLLGCAGLTVVTAGLLYLLHFYVARRRGCLVREAGLLPHGASSGTTLPHVVVQVPVFNEGVIVQRAIAALARLDWPADKLHIQVCDDSTDDTTALAEAAAAQVRGAGIDAVVIRRANRIGFKAGSLQHAMLRTGHEYFAIFDVDFVPPPDFLRRCMTALQADPTLAFVQARIDFFNVDQSAFTRAQTVLLDYHYGFEQAIRSWANHLVLFNGTCGIWRRAAIEAAGGWTGDTLLEDWDLSYRAWLKGWRGILVGSVTAPGELPTSARDWMAQQRRWATGGGQVARKNLPAIAANGNLSRALRALTPLGTWLGHLLFSATIIAAVAAILLRPADAVVLSLVAYVALAVPCVVFFVVMLVVNGTLGRKTALGRFVLDFPLVILLSLYVSWANLRSLPGTLLGRSRAFVRTPKRGVALDLATHGDHYRSGQNG